MNVNKMKDYKFIYLIQTPGLIPPQYDWVREKEKMILSYKTNTEDTDIYFPGSTWTTGRNRLFEEVMKKNEHDYYVFLDYDLDLTSDLINDFEKTINCLKEDFPIIIPRLWNYNDKPHPWGQVGPKQFRMKGLTNLKFKCHTIDWMDGAFNAFHKSTIHELLPYIDTHDNESWHYSQLFLIAKANFLFRNKLVQINTRPIKNKAHSEYPRKNKRRTPVITEYINTLTKNDLSNFSTSDCIKVDCDES